MVKRVLIALSLTLVMMGIPTSGSKADGGVDKNAVVVKILMEVTHYVKFKLNDNGSLPTLCVVDNPQVLELVELRNRNYPVFKAVISVRAVQLKCDLVYAEAGRAALNMLTSPQFSQSLKISNYEDFVDEGGAIGIVDRSGRVVLNLNLTSAAKVGAVFHPDIIEISKRVIQ